MGQYEDEETGLNYNLARYYSRCAVSYLAERSATGGAASTWATNYSYSRNDPWNRVGPKGGLPSFITNGLNAAATALASRRSRVSLSAASSASDAVGSLMDSIASTIASSLSCIPCALKKLGAMLIAGPAYYLMPDWMRQGMADAVGEWASDLATGLGNLGAFAIKLVTFDKEAWGKVESAAIGITKIGFIMEFGTPDQKMALAEQGGSAIGKAAGAAKKHFGDELDQAQTPEEKGRLITKWVTRGGLEVGTAVVGGEALDAARGAITGGEVVSELSTAGKACSDL